MPYFDSRPRERVLREFTVFRDSKGHWIASETHGLPGGVFDSRDEAVRFALWQSDGDPARFTLSRPPSFGLSRCLLSQRSDADQRGRLALARSGLASASSDIHVQAGSRG